MKENELQKNNENQLPSVFTKEVSEIQSKVEDLENEVYELKKDIQAIDLLQRKPVISTDSIAVIGFFVIVGLVVIGIFY